MRWTEGQRAAIEGRGNLIVSAAAGAGKTAVLTERLCSLVAGGVPVDRLLVLTFTRAAAAEMKQRISDRLQRAVEEAEDAAQRAYLLAQAAAVGSAYICTIDAFCTRIIRRHGHVLGLSASLRVADEIELAVLAANAKDATLAALAAEEGETLSALLAAFASEDAAWTAIQALHSFLDAQPEPERWLSEAVDSYRDAAYAERLLETLLSGMQMQLRAVIEALTRCRDAVPPHMPEVISVLDDDLLKYRALLLCRSFDAYREGLSSLSFQTLRFPRGTADSEKKPIQDARRDAKERIKKQLAALPRSAREETALLARGADVLDALKAAACRYRETLAAAKRKRGVIDFADVERLALALLSEERIAAEYRQRFLYIAVDEYQDSNGLQEALLARIRREDNLFLVGDVKQSIYRFRGAEPSLFLEKLADWNGGAGSRVDLSENFRSAGEVLAAVNSVFSAVMSPEVGELAYDARARLYAGASVPHGGAVLHLVPKTFEEGALESEALEDMEDAAAEARLIAGRIRALMEETPCFDARLGRERPLRYGDFAVLLRATGQAQVFAETLALSGIPCFAQSSGGYFDAIEVMVLLNCLRVIDNRRQDIPLLSVLRSALFGFSEEALLQLRLRRREGAFYEAFFAAAQDEDGSPLTEQVRAAANYLEALRLESELCGVTELLTRLMDDTGYYEQMGALPAGAQRQRNLDALLSRAQAFEASGARGISRFLAAMDHASSNARIGAPQDGAGDVCRILSIHRSKGLEFPVVFVAQMGRRFHMGGAQQGLLLHGRLGMGLRFLREGVRRDTAAYRAISETQRLEQLSEEMRVLYVAMTRAKQRLELVASVRDIDAALARSEEHPSPAAVARAASPLPWLLSGSRAALPVLRYRREDLLCAPPPPAPQEAAPANAPETAALAARFSYRYPFRAATALPSKQAVSRVSEAKAAPARPEQFRFDPPAFISGGELTPAMRGTATHLLLERLPLRQMDAAEVTALLGALQAQGVYDGRDVSGVRAGDVAWFTKTSLFSRMAKSPRVQREWSFALHLPADQLFPTDAEEMILLQGVIDCCFLEDGAWVLLDYKTDRLLPGESVPSLAERHREQLALYARALETLTGLPVREQTVVLLAAHACFSLEKGA